jgi:putative endopeptidase
METMTLACRPLFAALLLSLATTAHAARKPGQPSIPTTPAACADFYAHVNQDWLAAHPLPAGAQSFSRWDVLNTSALQQVRALLAPGAAPPAGVASRLRADADAAALTSGFTGDPLRPLAGKVYGPLVTAAAY